MFSRRRRLAKEREYKREFFESLVTDLSRAGLSQLVVKLPHNRLAKDEPWEISISELLKRERNYPALVLQASNPQKSEVMKILFINVDTVTHFMDDTFPSGQSEWPALYFQSNDPARAYAVFEYFYEYLCRPSVRGYWLLFLGFVGSVVFIIAELIAMFGGERTFLGQRWNWVPLIDILLIGTGLMIAFRFFAVRKGLWIKETREIRLLNLLYGIFRGEFSDNPLVMLLVIIVGGLVVTVLAKLLGLE